MRKIIIQIVILAAMLCLNAGCVQKVKVNLLKPGEIKISELSKIAVLPFNSVKPNIAAGKYSASGRICDLARRCVTDALYAEPHFQLVDLDIEKKLNAINRGARPKNRLNGLLYGQVWWQVSDEYKNFAPSKKSLRKWRTVRYACGTNDDGSTRYCTKTLTTQKKDEFYKAHYRTMTATLMMSLNLYRMGRNGKVEKVAQVFEVARKPAEIYNGAFSTNLELIGFNATRTRPAPQEKDGFSLDFISEKLGLVSKAKEKTALDNEVSNKNESIPATLNMENALAQEVAKRLRAVIQPHYESFEVSVHGKDKKTHTLFMTEAYRGLTKYLALKIADKNGDLAETLIEDLDFDSVAKEVLLRRLKAEHAAKQEELPAEEREPFKAPDNAELAEDAESYLDNMTSDIYNLGLAFEGLGDFERSLYIYRNGFKFEDTDQDMADGIGRSALALDYDVVVNKQKHRRDDSADKTVVGLSR
ncbi:hypothetical protein [Maridesulfovibrio sp.]|uniref:hypothetical protein n=1 Tax=Maridesulfovibrio sp. TaxID=2795000 RepID=UPI002AA7E33A|nr:hypothetical protein [Maridesulfovibrio sp.]